MMGVDTLSQSVVQSLAAMGSVVNVSLVGWNRKHCCDRSMVRMRSAFHLDFRNCSRLAATHAAPES